MASERLVTALLQPCFPSMREGDPGYYDRVSEAVDPKVEIAGMGRRFAAITADWLMSWAVGSLVFEQSQGRALWIPGVFFLQIVLLTWLTGASAGQRLLGLSVRSYPQMGPLGFAKVVARTLLILLVIPAVVFDSQGRGLHDRIARSAVFRGRL